MNRKILVLGAGTAGCAAAIFLRQQGLQVLLIDRAKRPIDTSFPTVGESLSPDAAPLLKQLGVWEEFCQDGHLKCFGNISYWNSSEPRHHDFLQHPIGHSWHLDRTRFDNRLLEHAQQLGVEFHSETSVSSLNYAENQWSMLLTSSTGQQTQRITDFAVDATGRHSWLARQQGIDRLYESEQLALVNFLSISPDFEDSRTLVETAGDGWWYSAAIPGNRMVTAFFCPPAKAEKVQWLTEEGWQQLVHQAPQTASRIKAAEAITTVTGQFVAAHSSILERLQGPGWLAIGDAALTYDPIAAHGITMALTSARDAAEAISRHFSGDTKAPEHYEAVLWAAFQRYAEERQTILQ